MARKREAKFQHHLKQRIEDEILPGSFVMENDASKIQGILDLTVLYKDRYGMLEVKESANAPYQPNQEFYIEKFNGMAFASVIYPENEEQVLSDLQSALGSKRKARIPQS